MNNQEIKNLDQLDDFQILVAQERVGSRSGSWNRAKSFGTHNHSKDVVEVDYSS